MSRRLPQTYEGTAVRLPPHSSDAEQAVLGGVMLDPSSLHKVADMLVPEDFYRRDHQLIWQAIQELSEKRKPYDAVTVGEWFHRRGEAELIAGDYLVELARDTPSAANVAAYAEIVRDRSIKRRAIEFGTTVVNAGFDDSTDGEEVMATAQAGVIALMPQQHAVLEQLGCSMVAFHEDLKARYSGEAMAGMPTPWSALNKITHGLPIAVTTILAGRPSMGKSIFGHNVACASAARGIRTAMFSLEMSKNQLHRRGLAARGFIDHDWLLDPSQDHPDANEYWPRIATNLRAMRGMPLYVDDSADLSIVQLMARARAMHIREPLQLIVVDHLHDMHLDPRNPMRNELGRAMQGLNVLAKEMDIPVLALAQLNRQVTQQADKRPTLKDLRESGELEQKAGMVLFIHRDDYYEPTKNPGQVEIIVAKGRDVQSGTSAFLKNSYHQMRLDDYAPGERGVLADFSSDSSYKTEAEREAERGTLYERYRGRRVPAIPYSED